MKIKKNNILTLLNLSGMTHKDWAEKLGINTVTFTVKIHCKTSWKVEEAFIFASHFGLTIEQAFFDELELSKVVIK